MIEKKLITLPLKELHPYDNNPRINDEAAKDVAASIEQCGNLDPIEIDENGVILSGHTRLKALIHAGYAETEVIQYTGLTEEQKKKYRLLANKTAEKSEWDFEKLQEELEGLDFGDFDFGFPEPEEDLDIQEDEYSEDTPEEPITKLGDIWKLGDHLLICGDSSDPEVISRLMDGEKADMVFTDPPYGVAIGSKNEMLNQFQRSGRCTENIKNDTLTEEQLYDMLVKVFTIVRENCSDEACYYVTSPQGGSLGLMMLQMMKDAGLEVRHILMWMKNSATFSVGRLDYDYQHEPIFYTWTKSHHNYRGGENRTTVWKYDKPRKCDLHPTMKPVELVANALLDGTEKGMICLDVFGGSGTTLIACEQTGRKCRMCELDPHYCDVIVQRWETLTGNKAELCHI